MNNNIDFFLEEESKPIQYTYAIILAKYKDRWVFVRHKDRLTWELPAGHVEPGETVTEAAFRELKEETGAMEFEITPMVSYKGWRKGKEVFGKLFKSDIIKIGPLPDFEIAEVQYFDEIPENLTYPEIQREFIKYYLRNS